MRLVVRPTRAHIMATLHREKWLRERTGKMQKWLGWQHPSVSFSSIYGIMSASRRCVLRRNTGMCRSYCHTLCPGSSEWPRLRDRWHTWKNLTAPNMCFKDLVTPGPISIGYSTLLSGPRGSAGGLQVLFLACFAPRHHLNRGEICAPRRCQTHTNLNCVV